MCIKSIDRIMLHKAVTKGISFSAQTIHCMWNIQKEDLNDVAWLLIITYIFGEKINGFSHLIKAQA